MKKVYNKIESIVGSVITIRAQGIRYGELATIRSKNGISLAEVIRLEEDRVYLQVYQGTKGVGKEDTVEFLNKFLEVSFSLDLLGRIFDGKGFPKDGGPALYENMIPVKNPSVNPYKRNLPSHMIQTGIPMIDLFNTLVVSQKIPIFSSSGEPYNDLVARIAVQAHADVIVLGGIGLRHSDYLKMRHTLEEHGALARTVFFVHTASDPTAQALNVPDIALAVAEKFALQDKRVLVLLTDMTNFADALKEISITMEKIPSNRGYSGDLYSQLAERYEKAVDFEGAGSVTILGVTTMPGDDVTHPVPDNTGYITEGQFYLKNKRIDPFGSLSRLKQFVNGKTRNDHRGLMDAMIKLYASYKETVEKKTMGFTMDEWDTKLLSYGKLFETHMMDLSLNMSLNQALDKGWEILSFCFSREETALNSSLLDEFWPVES